MDTLKAGRLCTEGRKKGMSVKDKFIALFMQWFFPFR
jgi:hypothetical protein